MDQVRVKSSAVQWLSLADSYFSIHVLEGFLKRLPFLYWDLMNSQRLGKAPE